MSVYLPTSLLKESPGSAILLDDVVRPIIREYIKTVPEELNFQTITDAGTYDPAIGALTTGPITLGFGGYNTLKLANSNTGRPGINFYDYVSDKNSTLILEQGTLTADQQVQFPDASGTLVVNDGGLPFTVINAPITMSWGGFESVKLNPVGASGAPGSHISFIDHNSENVATLAAPQDGSLSGNRNLVLPNVSGTLAVTKYKVYTAIISQTGTAAPTANVLENTLGGTPVWTRTNTGAYVLTLSGAFTAGKTAIIHDKTFRNSNDFSSATWYLFSVNNTTSTILLYTGLADTNFDSIMVDGMFFEVRVYN